MSTNVENSSSLELQYGPMQNRSIYDTFFNSTAGNYVKKKQTNKERNKKGSTKIGVHEI